MTNKDGILIIVQDYSQMMGRRQTPTYADHARRRCVKRTRRPEHQTSAHIEKTGVCLDTAAREGTRMSAIDGLCSALGGFDGVWAERPYPLAGQAALLP